MEPLISVIVPICNSEKYLPKCLESLSAQRMAELEFILVDDGSTDGSGAICADFAARDGRFRLIRQEHGGVSAARNRGLDQAAGEYVMFVDSDDWVEPDFCEAPYRLAAQMDADVVFFCFQRAQEDGKVASPPRSVQDGVLDRKAALDLIFGASGSYLWNKLWRRRLFDGIRFPEGRCYEDVGTSYRPILQAQRLAALNHSLYYYRFRRGSQVTRRSAKAMDDYFTMHMARYETLLDWGYDPKILESRRCAFCLTYAMRRREDFSDPASITARRILREMPAIPRSLRRRQRLLLVLLRRCPPLFEWSCKLLKLRTDGEISC